MDRIIVNNHTTNQSTQPDMISFIMEWEESGQSQKLFCREKGIPVSKFYYWLRKYRRSQSNQAVTDFAPVRIRQSNGIGGLDIQYPNGVVVRLHAPVDMSMLRAMIQLL
jgi:hypothetical protein